LFPRAEVLPPEGLYAHLPGADVVVGAVLVPGAKAPLLISKKQMETMKPGAVMVDISIDQGGITEASRPTSIGEPCYMEGHVLMCCVPNIPGTVPDTSTKLLTEATLPYIIRLAEKGEDVLKDDTAFRTALNVRKGKCTSRSVAEARGIPYTPVDEVL
ncbi:MAG TPA: alanine dehydrogenase, partial [Spirochaetota bacterium]|nr:alanine dehydrogenase [Spirochaetota bacterium]